MSTSFDEYLYYKNQAVAKLQQQTILWSLVAMYTTKNHYMIYNGLNYGFNNADSNYFDNSFWRQLPNTWAYNIALDRSIENRITKDIQATFDQGILLTLADNFTTPDSVIYNHVHYEDSDKKKNLEETKKFYAPYGDFITSAIKNPKTNGTHVIKQHYTDLNLFGNACQKVFYDAKAKTFKHLYIPINTVAINRNFHDVIYHYFISKIYSYQDIVTAFPEKIVKQLVSEYGTQLTDNKLTPIVNITEWCDYDNETNTSCIKYYDDNKRKFLFSVNVLGCPYIYNTINRKYGMIYGTSKLLENIHSIIYLQTLTFHYNELVTKEATPYILSFTNLVGEPREGNIANSFVNGAYSQARGSLNNLENRVNQIQSFDTDKMGLIRAYRDLGINPFVDINTSYRNGETLILLRTEKENYEQKIGQILGDDITDQLENKTLLADNLKTDTFSEIIFRQKTSKRNEKLHYDDFIPFVANLYNSYLYIIMQKFIGEIKRLLSTHEKDDIMYLWDFYNNKNQTSEDNLFTLKLILQKEKLIANLQEQELDPEYDDARNFIKEIDKQIANYTKEKENADMEEKLQEVEKQLYELQLTRNYFIENVLYESVKLSATHETLEEFKKMKENDEAKFILFKIMPREVLEYHIDYFSSNSDFNNVFKIEFVGSAYKEASILAQSNILENIQILTQIAIAAEKLESVPQTQFIFNWREVFDKVTDPLPNKPNILYSEKQTDNLKEQFKQEQIQLQQALNNVQPQ